MGYYTHLNAKIKLKRDTPQAVIGALNAIYNAESIWGYGKVSPDWDKIQNYFDHEFFKCPRWQMCLLSNDFGTTKGGKFYHNGGQWVLELDTYFKNYNDEIEHFVDWIAPYVGGRKKKQYLGWSKGEDRSDRDYIHVNKQHAR